VWQAGQMAGSLVIGKANAYGWAELNAPRLSRKPRPLLQEAVRMGHEEEPHGRGPGRVHGIPGQRRKASPGGMEMNPMVPAQVPSYWLAYFTVAWTVDKEHKKGSRARGGRSLLEPADFPGWAILDPHRPPREASFGLLKMQVRKVTRTRRAGPATCRPVFLFGGENAIRQSPYEFPLPSSARRSGDRQEAA